MTQVIQIQMSPEELAQLITRMFEELQQKQNNELITEAEARKRLRIGADKFKALKLPAYKIGQRLYYKLSDLKPIIK